jgi:hypothetical protein
MQRTRNRALDIAMFVALMATALALGGALAHLYELPNKIGLGREAYFTVQQNYRGWNLIAFVLLLQLIGIAAAAWFAPPRSAVRRASLVAILALVAAQAVFWVFTFPTNVATENWTTAPENWAALRDRWEYSHAVGAGFQLLAMGALVVAALARARH